MTVHATPENKRRWKRLAAERVKAQEFYRHYEDVVAQREELLEALKYARRFLNTTDHDTAYIDVVLNKFRGETP